MNTADLAKSCVTAAAKAANDAAEQRALVLRHPDLAARLTRPPLDYDRPEQWNGYIPPAAAPSANQWARNDSPQRVHLVALVRQALARESGEQVAKAWLADVNTDRWSDAWTPHQTVEGNRP